MKGLKEIAIYKHKILFFSISLLLISSHFPFLIADPDIDMTMGSRGPWTDEGLYASQIRNYLLTGNFDIAECDNFLKTPLLSLYWLLLFGLFGAKLFIARFGITILTYIMLLLIYRLFSNSIFPLFFLLSTYTISTVHQHSHFAMAEVASSLFIVLSGLLLSSYIAKQKPQWIPLSILCIGASIGFKVQFIYVAILPFLSIRIFHILHNNYQLPIKKILAYTILLLLMYLTLLYLPFIDTWQSISQNQSGGIELHQINLETIKHNIIKVFLLKRNRFITIVFLLSILTTAYYHKNLRTTPHYYFLALFSLSWFLVEMHKIIMGYLPVRYYVSIYISMGLFITTTASFMYSHIPSFKKIHLSYLLIFPLAAFNNYTIIIAHNRRTFQLHHAQQIVATYPHHLTHAIGPWAPSLCWESQLPTYPLWRHFGNENILKDTTRTIIIFSENDEIDSDSAFYSRSIILQKEAIMNDSFPLSNWQVNSYYLPK